MGLNDRCSSFLAAFPNALVSLVASLLKSQWKYEISFRIYLIFLSNFIENNKKNDQFAIKVNYQIYQSIFKNKVKYKYLRA